MAAAEEYDWTRPYRTWEATLKKQDEQEDAAAASSCASCFFSVASHVL